MIWRREQRECFTLHEGVWNSPTPILLKTVAQQLWVLGKLSHAGSRRYRDYVIRQLSRIFIKMGQHSLYMKSTTGHICNFICNCLALLCSVLFFHSFLCGRKVYFMDLVLLKRRDWKRFNASRGMAVKGAWKWCQRESDLKWKFLIKNCLLLGTSRGTAGWPGCVLWNSV